MSATDKQITFIRDLISLATKQNRIDALGIWLLNSIDMAALTSGQASTLIDALKMGQAANAKGENLIDRAASVFDLRGVEAAITAQSWYEGNYDNWQDAVGDMSADEMAAVVASLEAMQRIDKAAERVAKRIATHSTQILMSEFGRRDSRPHVTEEGYLVYIHWGYLNRWQITDVRNHE